MTAFIMCAIVRTSTVDRPGRTTWSLVMKSYNGAEVLPADTRTVEFCLAIVVFDRTNLYQGH